MEGSDDELRSLIDLEKAIETAARCIECLNKEIRERLEQHNRFFGEVDARHERWIARRRQRLCEVEVLHQEHKATLGDKKRLAEEKLREAALAEEQRHAEEERLKGEERFKEDRRLKEEQRLEEERRLEEEQFKKAAEALLRLQRTSASRNLRTPATSPRCSTCSHRTASHTAPARAALVSTTPARPPLPKRKPAEPPLPARPTPQPTTSKPAPPVCIAYLASASTYIRIRCTDDALTSTPRCQEHQIEYNDALSLLEVVHEESERLDRAIRWIIRRASDPSSISRVAKDLVVVSYYIELSDAIMVSAAELQRLDGYPEGRTGSSNDLDMAAYCPTWDVYRLRTKLKGKLSGLKAEQAQLSIAVSSAQHEQAAQVSHWGPSPTPITPWHSPRRRSRVRTAIAAVAERVASLFHLSGRS